MEFKDILKQLREEKSVSGKKLSVELQFSPNLVYAWEKGRAQPNIETLIKLAEYFDVSVDYLIGATDDFNTTAPAKSAPGLSKREEELLKAFDCLDVYQQDFFFNQITATARENTLIKK